MNFIQNILPENIIYATGIMLLHILWQGLIIAFLLGLLLIIFRNSSAHSRYIAGMVAMSLLPITGLITLFVQLETYSFRAEFQDFNITENIVFTGTGQGMADNFLALYVNYLPIIVLMWFTGISALLLKSLGKLLLVQRLKSYYLKEIPEYIQNLVSSISAKFNIRKRVLAFISTKAETPMIIGHLKPVLLLPESAINILSRNELSVIIHHELAHIKRNDYLMNIMQTVIEILFFFHPATWWISRIIRREREECCDTYAIGKEYDRITLAKALTSIQQTRLSPNFMAMSATGTNHSLIKRIKNMFKNRPVLPSFKEGILVTLFFVVTIGLMSFMIHSDTSNRPESNENISTTVSGELSDESHLFAKIDESGNIIKLFVEGKKINKRKYPNYQASVDSIVSGQSVMGIQQKVLDPINKGAQIQKDNYNAPEAINHDLQEALKDFHEDFSPEEKDQLKDVMKGVNGIVSEILSEVTSSMSEKPENEIGGNYNFDIHVDEDGEKVDMKTDENNFTIDVNDENEKVFINFNTEGLVIDIDEEGEKVKMKINEEGMYLYVEEAGEETVNIRFGANETMTEVNDD